MALRNQGFERNLNLKEAIDDRQVLNNLGGGNISADIAIFRNNTHNVSTLTWEYDRQSSLIANNQFVFPLDVAYVFTKGDEVNVSGVSLGNINTFLKYYVVNYSVRLGARSNQLGFGLSPVKDGTPIDLGSINGNVTFTRFDELKKENIINIASPVSLEDPNIAGGYFYGVENFSAAFSRIEERIDIANYLRSEKYAQNASVFTDKTVRVEGASTSADPAGFNSSAASLTNVKSPGIYIINPFTSTISNMDKVRAYTSNEQPWIEKDATELDPRVGLLTNSAQVNIGDLLFENGVVIDSFDGVTDVSGVISDVTSGFTHKLPILIDGIQYFALARLAT